MRNRVIAKKPNQRHIPNNKLTINGGVGGGGGANLTKRTIKYLATSSGSDPRIQKYILRTAPDSVIKSICNAALNARQGDIQLAEPLKEQLARHRHTIEKILSRQISVEEKRKTLLKSKSRGGGGGQTGKGIGVILPFLLQAVLSGLGSSFIAGISNKNNNNKS